jgi:hypothetical protein
MALVADRAERAGSPQGIGFGVTNTAWAVGRARRPAVGGALGEASAIPSPTSSAAALCALTLVAATAGTRALAAA